MRAPLPTARVNVMQEPWFDPATYRSDSNQHWRSGCPHEELARRRVPVAAAAHAPGDLGVPGRDDGADDARDARRREGERARSSSWRDDRIDLDVSREPAGRSRCSSPPPVRPGTAALAARPARERRARGAPRRHRHVRALRRPAPLRRLPPRPGRLRRGLPDAMPSVVEREGVDVRPAPVLVRPRGPRRRTATTSRVPVLVSSPDTICRSNDKAETLRAAAPPRAARARRSGA